VQALGGSITVDSRSGHGTAIVVGLPLQLNSPVDPLLGIFDGEADGA
jgi:signal transduction histidine kinase